MSEPATPNGDNAGIQLAETPTSRTGATAPDRDCGEAESSASPGRWRSRARALLPWGSLSVGLASALLMNRSPERAPLVAAGAVALWLTLCARHLLLLRENHDRTAAGVLLRVARTSSLIATQGLIQLSLFFALPFYLRAMAFDALHGLFMLLLLALCAVSLWDPWTAKLLHRSGPALVLPAVASFVALNAVLPGLGVSNQLSLWLAATAAALLGPVALLAGWRTQSSLRLPLWAALFAIVPPAIVLVGGARMVPAAPLRLSEAAFGTTLDGHWIADPIERLEGIPAQLYCATAIYAPFGVKERLYHVWKHNGRERQRIELQIVGGRKDGFRTRSRKSHWAQGSYGTWRCEVQTGSGQFLGAREIVITRPRGGHPAPSAESLDAPPQAMRNAGTAADRPMPGMGVGGAPPIAGHTAPELR